MVVSSRVNVFQAHNKDKEGDKKKKESILELQKLFEKPVRVKFSGGREGRRLMKIMMLNNAFDDHEFGIPFSERYS